MRRLARRPDAKSVRVKKSKSTKAGSAPVTKFKVRCSKVGGRSNRTSLTAAQHLHTLIVKESDKADKVRAVSTPTALTRQLRQSLPPSASIRPAAQPLTPAALKVEDIGKTAAPKKKA